MSQSRWSSAILFQALARWPSIWRTSVRGKRDFGGFQKVGGWGGPGLKILQILISSGNYRGEMEQLPSITPIFWGGNSTPTKLSDFGNFCWYLWGESRQCWEMTGTEIQPLVGRQEDPEAVAAKCPHHLILQIWINTWVIKWVCLKMVSTPLYPMVLLIIIPFLNGYFIGNIPNIFKQTQMSPFFTSPNHYIGINGLLDGYYFRWCPIAPSHGTFTNPCNMSQSGIQALCSKMFSKIFKDFGIKI